MLARLLYFAGNSSLSQLKRRQGRVKADRAILIATSAPEEQSIRHKINGYKDD